jgi:SAM-dependent methyltransferase
VKADRRRGSSGRAAGAGNRRLAAVAARSELRPSQQLFDSLAPEYDAHFDVPHRRLYDELAWERVVSMLPAPGPGVGPVVDAGCGTGRWARRLVSMGYQVVGIEQAPGMIAELERAALGDAFRLVVGSMDQVGADDVLGARNDRRGASMVLAMGSLQYTADPEATVAALASWLAPDGVLAILVDSYAALVLELLGSDRADEGRERVRTRRGVWRIDDLEADLHLLDSTRLRAAFEAAGLRRVCSSGLLVSAAALGRERLLVALRDDYAGMLELERLLAADPALADSGKQLLVTGVRSG